MIIDFIPNHTSDKHKWFQESRKGGENNPYKDYYVWHPGKLGKGGRREPPSNWVRNILIKQVRSIIKGGNINVRASLISTGGCLQWFHVDV